MTYSSRSIAATRRAMFMLAVSVPFALMAAARPAAGAGAPATASVALPSAVLPVEVDLAAVLRLAHEASLRLKIDREAVSAAEARRISAGLLPNPRIALGRARPGGGAATLFDGREQTDASIEFPLLLGGQRQARVEAAERFIEVARAQVGVGANLLAEEAAVAFVAILAAQARSDALVTAIDRIGRIRDIVAAREANGLASRYDVARVDVERAALQARLAEQAAERADATGALAVLLGVPGWSPKAAGALAPLAAAGEAVERSGPAPASRRVTDSMATSGAASAADRERMTALHPSVVAAQREEAAAAAVVEVARRERIPVPSLGIGRMWTRDPYGGANFIGLSVELPIFDTRRGPVAEAQAEARAAALRRTLVEAQVDAGAARYRAVVQRRVEALERFDTDAAARLPMLQTMAEDAYRFGRGSILEWLDANRTQHEQGLLRVDLLTGLAEARMRLRGALGVFGAGGG